MRRFVIVAVFLVGCGAPKPEPMTDTATIDQAREEGRQLGLRFAKGETDEAVSPYTDRERKRAFADGFGEAALRHAQEQLKQRLTDGQFSR